MMIQEPAQRPMRTHIYVLILMFGILCMCVSTSINMCVYIDVHA